MSTLKADGPEDMSNTSSDGNADEGQNPGPEPGRLKIDGDWEDAVKQAISKPPPKDDGKPTKTKPDTA